MVREEVIKMLRGMKADNLNLDDLYTKDKYEALDMAIKALEQEGYYKDLAQSYEKTIVKLNEAIAERLSGDCVSRQAVLEVLKNNRYRFNISQEGYCEGKVLWSENLIKDDACNEIEQLPPVTPTRKKGKWIEEPNCWLRCSCCNSHHPHTSIYAIRGSNYCPECGAEMESEK